jgi:hypothetical protein
MKRRRPTLRIPARSEAAAIRTGEHCPESGWWYPVQRELDEVPMATLFIGEGSVMPGVGGTPSLWLPAPSPGR